MMYGVVEQVYGVVSPDSVRNISTRQLPMGAGHCPWGGYPDRWGVRTRSDGLGATGLH